MKRLALLVLVLSLIPFSVDAATYSWTDRTGTVHFTDDPGSIPRQFRKKALQQADGNDTVPPPQAAPSATPSTTAASSKELKAVTPPAIVADTPIAPSTRFGNWTAAEWQTQLRALRAELADIQQKQEALKKETGGGKKLLTKGQITDINTRNKQLYGDYETTRRLFNNLVEQANKVGLPAEFSQ